MATRPTRRGHSRSISSATLVRSYRASQPDAEQTIRAGGSSPRFTTTSTGPRPWVARANRVSFATDPFASLSMTARSTSTTVEVSRPSRALDRTDHEAATLSELGVTLVDSRTVHSEATLSA